MTVLLLVSLAATFGFYVAYTFHIGVIYSAFELLRAAL